jgi:Do/DeqQ family serine protease
MNSKTLLTLVTVSFLSAAAALGGYKAFEETHTNPIIAVQTEQPVRYANFSDAAANNAPVNGNIDFTYAAAISTPGVVHVTSTSKATQGNPQFINPFDFFGGGGGRSFEPQPRVASGSGVIISPDGYIVTNNHVIAGASEVEVVLNDKQKYVAQIIGTDPSTDIALLKIDATNLIFLPFANSDSVRVGEWVLAVGNPFNLESTVTAGIISAKGRSINILEDNAAIESFIQTDAAVNPGNSGGALVDLRGQLIGVNTAIASPTGTFAGYSFAVPSNLVRKVVGDLKEFGLVQRGFLGVTIRNVEVDQMKTLKLPDPNGVYINEVMDGSAADDAGLKPGDVIRSINGSKINSTSQLQETVAQFRPSDKLNMEYYRDGKLNSTVVTLRNKNQGLDLLSKENMKVDDLLGVSFEELSADEKRALGIKAGVKVKSIGNGAIKRYTDMHEGFIITHIDRQPITSKEKLAEILNNKKGGVMVEGVYPDQKGTFYYAFGL